MKCQICKTDNARIIQHKVSKCSNCGHTYIHYDGDGSLYHKEEYRKLGQEGNKGSFDVRDGKFTEEFHKKRIPIAEKRLNVIKPYIPECNSLLDIGAGGGTFLSRMKDYFEEVEGTEISDFCIEDLRRNGHTVYHGAFPNMEIPKKYDLVTCWHVLEHIPDVTEFSKKAAEVTNKYLVLEVPIHRRLRNPDTEFDGHFHYFSKKSLKILFKNEFKILSLEFGIQKPSLLCILQKT